MSTLSDTLRSKLENTVIKAREHAEKGARAALEGLEVHLGATTRELTPDERELRKRLRAHGRQIGDVREPQTAHQTITHLTWECAYQHWHRMLFARFLAENQVLIHPELKVVVTLEECAELAKEEGLPDAWAVAARYASRMLPQIFRQDHPVLQLRLPAEFQRSLENLLAALPSEVFYARDSLGWVYQFWQTKRKDEINKSEVKIGADELPAVTQLFTEPYMVDFLLQNSLGAWWVGAGRPLPEGLELPYLRLLDDGSPAAGKFEGWPSRTAELKVLDPCCGSGHFLVAALDLLTRFRMTEEGLSAREAGDAVLRDNLFGLELDERCTQIAAFAVALAAWTFPGADGWRPLPTLSIACSGLSVAVMPKVDETEEELKERQTENKRRRDRWIAIAGKDERKRQGMTRLFDLFADAPVLGSLIDPSRDIPMPLLVAPASELKPLLQRAMKEAPLSDDPDERENQIAAAGIAEAAQILGEKYHLIVTNVPYLGRGGQCDTLKRYSHEIHIQGMADLATTFLLRLFKLSASSGVVLVVAPNAWLLQMKYQHVREHLLRAVRWKLVARLGPGAFRTISGQVVNVVLSVFELASPSNDPAWYIEVPDASQPTQKAESLRIDPILPFQQLEQLHNPEAKVLFRNLRGIQPLEEFAFSTEGLSSGDADRFVRTFWELAHSPAWEHIQTAPTGTEFYSGLSYTALWDNGRSTMALSDGARIRGHSAWGARGVVVSKMSTFRVSPYCGGLFSKGCAVLTPRQPEHLLPVMAFVGSKSYADAVTMQSKSLAKATSAFEQVPFDLAHWQQVAAERYPNGLPKPYSDDPTQWLFHGHPRPSTSPLQVAIGRLLGYTWPAETDEKMELSDEARAWIARAQSLKAHVDQDGIVCLPSVRGEAPASERLQALLADAFGEEWSSSLLEGLLKDVQCAGWNLDRWLRDKFFEQHCAFFHHRPFVWHIWDGRKDGFSALVNYHALDHKRLETLVYDYLGDWIRRQQDELNQSVDGARERLDAAVWLKGRLEAILEGEAPYDIFVRWKPLEKQPIGWEPDINDGVRLNIRPFVEAGVLRKEPKIKWDKDRGKDPAGSPWGEERLNDRHLTLEEKRMGSSPLSASERGRGRG